MNPNKFNNKTTLVKINGEIQGIKKPIDLRIKKERDFWEYYLNPMKHQGTYSPICILPPHKDQRLKNQEATFTLHGECIYSLDGFESLNNLLHQIFIPYKYLKNIRKELKKKGIIPSFIYPGLDGLCQELKEEA